MKQGLWRTIYNTICSWTPLRLLQRVEDKETMSRWPSFVVKDKHNTYSFNERRTFWTLTESFSFWSSISLKSASRIALYTWHLCFVWSTSALNSWSFFSFSSWKTNSIINDFIKLRLWNSTHKSQEFVTKMHHSFQLLQYFLHQSMISTQKQWITLLLDLLLYNTSTKTKETSSTLRDEPLRSIPKPQSVI